MKTTTGRKFNAPLIHNPERPTLSPKEIEKIKAEHRKRYAREFAPIMFETTTGARLTKGETPPPPRELFGPLWREGDLAILAGPNGVGKTLLAIHLAESLARGTDLVRTASDSDRALHSKSSPPYEGGVDAASADGVVLSLADSSENSPLSTVNSQLAPQPVLYIDLCHSLEQFRQRYTCPSIFPERPSVKYRFSSRFHRAGFDKYMTVPEAFEGKFLDYYNHSIQKLIDNTDAKVIIIDDLAELTPTTLSNAARARVLRNLKTFTAHQNDISILVLTDTKHKVKTRRVADAGSGGRNYSLFTVHHSLVGIADSVFCLSPSTFSPDIRYVKQIRGSRVAVDNGQRITENGSGNFPLSAINYQLPDVFTFQLGMTPGPRASAVGTQAARLPLAPPENYPLSTVSCPFLGMTFLGMASENDHLRDYAAEALAATRAHQAELKKLWRRSSKEILVDGVIDGSYGKYLKGE